MTQKHLKLLILFNNAIITDDQSKVHPKFKEPEIFSKLTLNYETWIIMKYDQENQPQQTEM